MLNWIFLLAFLFTSNFSAIVYAQDTLNCPSGNIVWYPPIQLSPDTIDCNLPSIAVQGETVHVTWYYTGLKFPYVRSVNNGESFEPLRELISDTFQNSGGYYLLNSGNRLFGFFAFQMPNGFATFRQIYSDDRGTSWSNPQRMYDSLTKIDSYAAHMDSLFFYIGGYGRRRFLFSTDRGASWTPIEGPTLAWGLLLDLAMTPGVVHMVKSWMFDSAGYIKDKAIQYRRSTDLGTTWSDSIPLSGIKDPMSLAYDPSIAADEQCDGTGVVVTWRDTKHGWLGLIGASIIERHIVNSSGEWSEETVLTPEPRGYAPMVTVQGQTETVVWLNEYLELDNDHYATTVGQYMDQDWCPMIEIGKVFNFNPEQNGNNGDKMKSNMLQISIANIALNRNTIHVVFNAKQGIGPTFPWKIFYRRAVILPSNARFAVDRNQITFDSIKAGTTLIDSVMVFNDGTAPLIIRSIRSTDPNFIVTNQRDTIDAQSAKVYYVSFSPLGPGERHGKIVFRHNGDSAESPYCVEVRGTGIGHPVSIKYESGWNLISLPVVTDVRYNPPSLFKYDSGYLKVDSMVQGMGYWAKPPMTMEYFGGYLYADTISVKRGWNIIGALSFPALKDSIWTIPDGILVDNKFYGYNKQGYFNTDTLQPGRGYWVKVREDGKIILKAE